MVRKDKGATLGIVIVLILFLSLIAIIIMSMASIVSLTVIKNDKLQDQELLLTKEAQEVVNHVLIVSYTGYFEVLNDETEQKDEYYYYNYIVSNLESYEQVEIIVSQVDEVDEVDEVIIASYEVENTAINKEINVVIGFYSFNDIDLVDSGSNPFFRLIKWENKNIESSGEE